MIETYIHSMRPFPNSNTIFWKKSCINKHLKKNSPNTYSSTSRERDIYRILIALFLSGNKNHFEIYTWRWKSLGVECSYSLQNFSTYLFHTSSIYILDFYFISFKVLLQSNLFCSKFWKHGVRHAKRKIDCPSSDWWCRKSGLWPEGINFDLCKYFQIMYKFKILNAIPHICFIFFLVITLHKSFFEFWENLS